MVESAKVKDPSITAFFIMGLIFIPIGCGLLGMSNIKEFGIDYTGADRSSPCFNCSQTFRWDSAQPCTCSIPFYLDQPYGNNVFMYYALSNFYQNHRRYVKSRDNKQLNGRVASLRKPSKKCEPYASHDNKPIAPCGAIANSMFNDKLELFYHHPNGTKDRIPLRATGIAWWTDKHVNFKNPRSNMNLTAVFKGTTKPINWRWPVYELDTDQLNNGFANEDLMVWMQPAPFPNFRKLYRIVNRKDSMGPTLLQGHYTLEVVYNFPVLSFGGRKKMILSSVSWVGKKNSLLAIAYIVMGSVHFFLGVVLIILRHKYRNCNNIAPTVPTEVLFPSSSSNGIM